MNVNSPKPLNLETINISGFTVHACIDVQMNVILPSLLLLPFQPEQLRRSSEISKRIFNQTCYSKQYMQNSDTYIRI